jgi:hypothetical protein
MLSLISLLLYLIEIGRQIQESYDPWGRPGGGAPLVDADGKVVKNVKLYLRSTRNGLYPHPPEERHQSPNSISTRKCIQKKDFLRIFASDKISFLSIVGWKNCQPRNDMSTRWQQSSQDVELFGSQNSVSESLTNDYVGTMGQSTFSGASMPVRYASKLSSFSAFVLCSISRS